MIVGMVTETDHGSRVLTRCPSRSDGRNQADGSIQGVLSGDGFVVPVNLSAEVSPFSRMPRGAARAWRGQPPRGAAQEPGTSTQRIQGARFRWSPAPGWATSCCATTSSPGSIVGAAEDRGRGVPTRALAMFSTGSFHAVGLHELWPQVQRDNIASRQVAMHSGYRRQPGRDKSQKIKGADWPMLRFALPGLVPDRPDRAPPERPRSSACACLPTPPPRESWRPITRCPTPEVQYTNAPSARSRPGPTSPSRRSDRSRGRTDTRSHSASALAV